jgi:hypothetical protein
MTVTVTTVFKLGRADAVALAARIDAACPATQARLANLRQNLATVLGRPRWRVCELELTEKSHTQVAALVERLMGAQAASAETSFPA